MKKVRDLMTSPVTRIQHDMPLVKVVDLMEQKMITGAPVVDPDGKVIGVVSRSDVAVHWARIEETPRKNRDNLARHVAADIMTPFVFQVGPDDPVTKLVDVMLGGHIHRVVVCDGNGEPVGIVTSMDIVRDYKELAEQVG
ncbi:MAG: CBS domain-containing protein [Candidatus Eremiobacterota bacterium]